MKYTFLMQFADLSIGKQSYYYMAMPAHSSKARGEAQSLNLSLGAVAAFLPERMTGPLVKDELARLSRADEPELRLSKKHIEEDLDDVRERRMARAVGHPIPGINAFCAPVFDHTGHIALAITAMGPAGTFDPDWDGATARRVKACAEAISGRLGKTGA